MKAVQIHRYFNMFLNIFGIQLIHRMTIGLSVSIVMSEASSIDPINTKSYKSLNSFFITISYLDNPLHRK